MNALLGCGQICGWFPRDAITLSFPNSIGTKRVAMHSGGACANIAGLTATVELDRWPPFPRTLAPRTSSASWASRGASAEGGAGQSVQNQKDYPAGADDDPLQ